MGESHYDHVQQLTSGEYLVDDLVAKYVNAVGQRVAEFSDRKLPYEFVVVNDSTLNAWALPGGKIGIHRGLLVELENGAELAAVLGHEIVHAAAKHGANRIQRGLLLDLASLGVELAVDDSNHAREIVGATNVGIHLAGKKFSRDDERMADRHGMEYMHKAGYDTRAAVTLHEKLLAKAESRGSDWLTGLLATHPPSRERLENNRAFLTQYLPGGDLAEASFRFHMRSLFDDRSAYKLADQAREATRRDTSRALRLIERAIDHQPRESLFHGIRGDILASQGRHQDAMQSYTVAITQNADYFGHYLGRALSFDAMGYKGRARDDFRQSYRLFPTSIASYKLGHYALTEGNREEAKRHFEFASKANGRIGKMAQNAYARLDVE